jgi:fluoride exporter
VFSWAHLGLVVLGGTLGTAVRAGLTLVGADALGPVLVPVINVVGAFALGLVIGALSRHPPTAAGRAWQQFAGTGVLGGFTTYSALAVAATGLSGLAWGAATVVVGTAAAAAGLMLAGPRRRA